MSAREVPARRVEAGSFAVGDGTPPPQSGAFQAVNSVPPSAVGLRREALLRRLDPVARDHLGLLLAPAGSGKTTLMAQWAQSAAMPVAWCRLDAAAAMRDPTAWLWQALAPHLSPRPQPSADVPELIQVLQAHPARLLLVLDDLHTIAESGSMVELERFILLASANLRVLLGSRVMPQVNMARHELPPVVLLTGDDPRFRTWEVEKLFRHVHRAPLRPHDGASVHRTASPPEAPRCSSGPSPRRASAMPFAQVRGVRRCSCVTCAGVSSSTLATCRSFIVRTTWSERISMARSTPSRPPAMSPYR